MLTRSMKIGIALMIFVSCLAGSFAQKNHQIESKLVATDFEKIKTGMTYQVVTGILGKPCYERTDGPWIDAFYRTVSREMGLYVGLRDGKVAGTARLKRGDSVITFNKGEFNGSLMVDIAFKNELFKLLENPNSPGTPGSKK